MFKLLCLDSVEIFGVFQVAAMGTYTYSKYFTTGSVWTSTNEKRGHLYTACV